MLYRVSQVEEQGEEIKTLRQEQLSCFKVHEDELTDTRIRKLSTLWAQRTVDTEAAVFSRGALYLDFFNSKQKKKNAFSSFVKR